MSVRMCSREEGMWSVTGGCYFVVYAPSTLLSHAPRTRAPVQEEREEKKESKNGLPLTVFFNTTVTDLILW